MNKKTKQKAIKSGAVEFIESFLAQGVKVINLKVENKWLVAKLSSGVTLG